MALIGLLITLVIIVALLFISPFNPLNKQTPNPKVIESNAQNAVNATLERSKLEQSQVQEIDSK